MTSDNIQANIKNIRRTILKMSVDCGTGVHLGGGLSLVEIMAVLYGQIMNVQNKQLPFANKDKCILSKGHGVLGLYSAMAEFGIITQEQLETFQQDGSDLIAHPIMNEDLGIEASCGSLGQGISMAVGLALSAKLKNYTYKTYAVCGNGECNEGSVWEAAMSAVNFKLDNLTIIIDNNAMQSDGLSSQVFDVSSKYKEMFQSLGFQVIDVDGHDARALFDAFTADFLPDTPKVIMARTIKGKGIDFMENNPEWHHNRLTNDQYNRALESLDGVC